MKRYKGSGLVSKTLRRSVRTAKDRPYDALGRKRDHEPGCAVPGCEEVYYGRDLCRKHHGKWSARGKPEPVLEWAKTWVDRVPHGDPGSWPLKRHRKRFECWVQGCDLPHQARGFCIIHYSAWWYRCRDRVRKKTRPKVCLVPNCGKPHWGRGYCLKHYHYWYDHGVPVPPPKPEPKRCSIPGCDRVQHALDRCHMHYQQVWKLRRKASYRTGREEGYGKEGAEAPAQAVLCAGV